MYNGIGLQTARGSGTNGYIQRNLSHIPVSKEKVKYRTEEEIKRADAALNRGPNLEILDHERKRKVELKCLELRDLMEDQGYSTDEIEQKVDEYRDLLVKQSASSAPPTVKTDDSGRDTAKETHAIAMLQNEKNARLKAAFGISDDFVEGSSMDRIKRQMAGDSKKLEEKSSQKQVALPITESFEDQRGGGKRVEDDESESVSFSDESIPPAERNRERRKHSPKHERLLVKAKTGSRQRKRYHSSEHSSSDVSESEESDYADKRSKRNRLSANQRPSAHKKCTTDSPSISYADNSRHSKHSAKEQPKKSYEPPRESRRAAERSPSFERRETSNQREPEKGSRDRRRPSRTPERSSHRNNKHEEVRNEKFRRVSGDSFEDEEGRHEARYNGQRSQVAVVRLEVNVRKRHDSPDNVGSSKTFPGSKRSPISRHEREENGMKNGSRHKDKHFQSSDDRKYRETSDSPPRHSLERSEKRASRKEAKNVHEHQQHSERKPSPAVQKTVVHETGRDHRDRNKKYQRRSSEESHDESPAQPPRQEPVSDKRSPARRDRVAEDRDRNRERTIGSETERVRESDKHRVQETDKTGSGRSFEKLSSSTIVAVEKTFRKEPSEVPEEPKHPKKVSAPLPSPSEPIKSAGKDKSKFITKLKKGEEKLAVKKKRQRSSSSSLSSSSESTSTTPEVVKKPTTKNSKRDLSPESPAKSAKKATEKQQVTSATTNIETKKKSKQQSPSKRHGSLSPPARYKVGAEATKKQQQKIKKEHGKKKRSKSSSSESTTSESSSESSSESESSSSSSESSDEESSSKSSGSSSDSGSSSSSRSHRASHNKRNASPSFKERRRVTRKKLSGAKSGTVKSLKKKHVDKNTKHRS